MQITDVAWMDRDAGVVTLGDNGIVSTWTRSVSHSHLRSCRPLKHAIYVGCEQVAVGEDPGRERGGRAAGGRQPVLSRVLPGPAGGGVPKVWGEDLAVCKRSCWSADVDLSPG